MLLSCALGLTFLAALSHAAVPNYVQLCARNSPTFNECARKSAESLLKVIVKGDKKLKIPVLDPLWIPEVKVEDSNLNILVSNATGIGINDVIFKKIHFDTDSLDLDLDLLLPFIKVYGKYTLSGKLLILPIRGNGDFFLNATNLHVVMKVPCQLMTEKGSQYLSMGKPNIKTVNPEVAKIHLSNLFNGEKLLQREMEEFIDKNWREVFDALAPPVLDGIVQLMLTYVQRLLKSGTYDEFFPNSQ